MGMIQKHNYKILTNPLTILLYDTNTSLNKLHVKGGIHPQTAINIKNGYVKTIYNPTLKKLEKFFHIDSLEFKRQYLEWKEQ